MSLRRIGRYVLNAKKKSSKNYSKSRTSSIWKKEKIQDLSYKVSIIVPVYNCKEYLACCVDSLLKQSYKNIEIILIDDGSTDGSEKICDDYSRDYRTKVIHIENGGPANARNVGIQNASGEFITFVDADDSITSNAIKSLIEAYEESKADIIIGDFIKMKHTVTWTVEERRDIQLDKSKKLNRREIIEYARSYLKKPNKNLLFAFSWGRLFKASIIKNFEISFDKDLHTFEDVAFNFDYLKYTNNIYFLKNIIYYHTTYKNYSSATMGFRDDPNKLFGFKKALSIIGEFLSFSLSKEDIKKEVGHAYVSLTIIQLIRICGQMNANNKDKIYKFISDLVNDESLRENIEYYSPSKGESVFIPKLIKAKRIRPIIWICKHKARKRYG